MTWVSCLDHEVGKLPRSKDAGMNRKAFVLVEQSRNQVGNWINKIVIVINDQTDKKC